MSPSKTDLENGTQDEITGLVQQSEELETSKRSNMCSLLILLIRQSLLSLLGWDWLGFR